MCSCANHSNTAHLVGYFFTDIDISQMIVELIRVILSKVLPIDFSFQCHLFRSICRYQFRAAWASYSLCTTLILVRQGYVTSTPCHTTTKPKAKEPSAGSVFGLSYQSSSHSMAVPESHDDRSLDDRRPMTISEKSHIMG